MPHTEPRRHAPGEGEPKTGEGNFYRRAPRCCRGYLIAFCDGHVEPVGPERLDELIWNP